MNIYEYVQGQITTYPNREIELYGHRQFNQHDLLEQIAAYTDSYYLSGMTDDLGRRKPFYNIVNKILHKQRTAEDIDTKDIKLSTTRPMHYAKSMLMTVANKKWMKETNFAKTLNEMTEFRGRDGGLLVKWVQDHLEVVPLLTTITDPTDIQSGTKISEMKYNAAELLEMSKQGWENLQEAIIMCKEYKNDDVQENGANPSDDYITVYIVDGVMPKSYIDENAGEYDYCRQMHVITLYSVEDDKGNDKTTGLTLFATELSKDLYKYLPYEKVSGRSLGRGMVEQSMESQMAVNESVINEKNTMDIASKAILTQPTGNGLNATNVLKVHDGVVLDYNIQAPNLMQATPSSLGLHAGMQDRWMQQQAGETSVRDVNTGNMPASATFRGMALQNQEANSLFELRREEMDIFLQEIYRDWVIPHLKKWVKTKDFLELELSSEEMQKVLTDYAYKTARKVVDDKYFNGDYDDAPAGTKFLQMSLDTEIEADRVLNNLKTQGKNWIKSDSKYLDGIEFELDILITGEQQMQQVYLSNQVDALNTYLANSQLIAQDPNAQRQLNQIFETMGLPHIDPTEAQAVPQGAPVELEAATEQ